MIHLALPVLFSAVAEPGIESRYQVSAGLRDGLIIVGAVGLLTLIIVIWASVWRKPRHRHHHSRHHSEEAPTLVRYRHVQHEDPGLLALLKPRRKRRKHRFHHRNPTLAETGGLPPIRPEGTPPSTGSPPAAATPPSGSAPPQA